MRTWAVTEPGKPLECLEIAAPAAPRDSEVIVEVTHCGVCHSDVHFWEGILDMGERKVPVEAIGLKTPYTLGHEIVGRVTAVGPDVEDVAPGDLRLVYPWIGCGTCASCARHEDNMCAAPRTIGIRATGGFAASISVPHSRYLIDIGDLDPALAATYACSGLTVYSAIRKLLPLPEDDPIILIGAGGLGLSGISILTALGHRNIVVLDVSERNRQAASELGARATLDPSGDDSVERLKRAAGGAVKSIIDLVNNSQTASLAFRALERGGKLVQVGLFGGSLSLPLMAMPTRGLTIVGNYVGSPGELRELIALARSGQLPPIPISTRPTSQVTTALQDLRDGKVKGRIVLASALTD